MDGSSLTVRTFGELLEHIQLVRPCTVNAEGDKVLTVVQGGRTRYIMLRVTTEDRVQVGLAEDVTAATQERLRIERERDYDVLTGLYNRQAFHRVSHELFQNPERLGVAALLMMDLDDLKHINDTYGHDWGRPLHPEHRPLHCGAQPAGHRVRPPVRRRVPAAVFTAIPAGSSCAKSWKH